MKPPRDTVKEIPRSLFLVRFTRRQNQFWLTVISPTSPRFVLQIMVDLIRLIFTHPIIHRAIDRL